MDIYEKAPTRPGLYWAQVHNCKWYNGIVRVIGVAPYLRVHSIYLVLDDMLCQNATIDEVDAWGPRIDDPNDEDDDLSRLAASIPIEESIHGVGEEVFPVLRKLVEGNNARLLPIINAREQFGIKKHGQTLMTGDGRYTPQEVIGEKMDEIVYLTKWFMQTNNGRVLSMLYAEIDQAERLVYLIKELEGNG